jgi:hypothetical protein
MLATLAAAAALGLAPAQTGTLNLTNVRTTYGELGAARADTRYLPGDLYFVAFDIEGITVSREGKVEYAMSMEVTDKAGKAILQPKPVERDELLPLGGNRLPARAFVILDLDQAPGTYTCKVTVTDRVTKASKLLQRTFEVAPKAFGIVGLFTSGDDKGELPAPPGGVVGQNLFIHCALVGFGRDRMKKPDAYVELRMVDESRKPTLAKPMTAVVPKELGENEGLVTARFLVPFNREGTFTAELKATDNTTGKTSTVTFPIRVTPSAR